MTTFATLGPIEFEPLTSPESFYSAQGYDYAKHDVVEGKPRLQWVGDDLEEITLRMRWHRMYCNPQMQFDLLRAAAASHAALPLVWGNGIWRGLFVITEVSEQITCTADDGSLISIECEAKLLEYSMSSVELREQELAETAPPALAPASPDQPGVSAAEAQPQMTMIPTLPDGTPDYASITDVESCRVPEYTLQ